MAAPLKNRLIGWAGVIVAFLFLFGALERVSDMVFYPWALASPPLMDRWAGRLTTGAGTPLALTLEMHRGMDSNGGHPCAKCNQLEGTITTCDAKGVRREYKAAGSPEDRQGRQLLIGAKPAVEPPPDGLELDVLRGTWDGADVLSMSADFFWRKGQSAISSTDDPATQPVPLPMQRASMKDFDALCGQLAAAR